VTTAPESSPAKLEVELRQALAGRRLAGELRLSEEELGEHEDCLFDLVGSGLSTRALASSYPALLVTYLSAVGVYRYEGGTFWPNVPIADPTKTSDLGRAFKAAVMTLGLRSFDDLVVGEGATEYVARILAHGGIPRYCLADFFGALHAGLRQTGSADDLLALWRTRPERLAHLDKPIGRFLRYGGAEGRDIVLRCTELVDETTAHGSIPDADAVGLPAYVVEEYARWRGRTPVGPSVGRATTLPRPRIELDFWSTTGPHLVIPSTTNPDTWWTIAGEDGTRAIRGSEIREQLARLEPSRSWDVSLEVGGVAERLFAFEGFSELPALFFDPRTAVLVRDPLNIRLESVVCLYPKDAALKAIPADGSPGSWPRIIETYPAPTGEWRGFELACLDLEGVSRLRVSHGDTERVLRVTTPASRPRLVGDVVVGVTTTTGVPVYSGPPTVLIPEDLREFEWSVRVRRGREVLAASTQHANSDGHLELLSDGTFGELDVHVTGVLGFDLHETIALAPELDVTRPTQLLLPSDTGVTLAAQARDGILIDNLVPPARVAVPDDGDIAAFEVRDADGRVLDLQVSVPRVVWGVVADGGSGIGFSSEVIRLDSIDVEQGRARALILRTGKPGLPVRLSLTAPNGVLQEPEGGETQEAEGRWAFDLRPYQDAVRQSADPLLRFELSVGPRTVHVANIVVRYAASTIRATSRIAEDFAEVSLSFDESAVVNSRVARLWSLDRPWEDPVEEAIPDGQAGHAVIRGYSRMPAGPYLAQIAVDDGWSRRVRPDRGSTSTQPIHVGDHAEWRARIAALDPTDALQAFEAVVADGHVSDETLDAIDFGEVAPEALTTFAWLLKSVPHGAALPHATNAIRKALLDSFEGLLRALATASDRGIGDAVTRRVELLCVRGFDKDLTRAQATAAQLDDDELRAAWRVVPVLAAAVDFAACDRDDGATQRLEQQLGSGHDGLPSLSGFAIDARLLNRPPELLRAMADVLDIFPGPLLERRTLEAACFEFLIAENAADEAEHPYKVMCPSQWFDSWIWLVKSLFSVSGYLRALEPRLAPSGTLPWAGLSCVTLAAAIHVRRQTDLWAHATRALDEALRFAPALVRHDLIAAELLIRRLRKAGEPC